MDEQNTNQSGPGPTRSIEDEWSNLKCIKLAFEENFPSVVRNIQLQKDIINRFFNFYLGTKPQKGLSVTDLVFSTIAIMPLHKDTEEFIWESSNYNEYGKLFFLTPEDKLNAEISNVKETPEELNNSAEKTKENLEDFEEESDEKDDTKNGNDDSFTIHQSENEEFGGREKGEVENKRLEKVEKNEFNDKFQANVNSNETNDTTYGKTETNTNDTRPKLPTDILWYGNKNKIYKKAEENVKLQYGPKENSAFTASCSKLIEEWDTNEKGRICLKYFFGIVALTLMRACTKTYMHLVNTFASKKFHVSISFIEGYFSYSVPQKKCVKSSYRTFSKRDSHTTKMFAKIVMNSFYIDKLRRDNDFKDNMKLNIFKLTLLAHTAGHGIGLVNMLQSLDGPTNIQCVEEVTYCEETAQSWHKLKCFLEKYMAKTSRERTHHWARIINGDHFRDLGCSNNYALAVILAVFIEKANKNQGIWQSTWLKRGDDREKYEKRGRVMYEQYTEKMRKDLLKKFMQFDNISDINQFEDLSFDIDNTSDINQFDDLSFDIDNTSDINQFDDFSLDISDINTFDDFF